MRSIESSWPTTSVKKSTRNKADPSCSSPFGAVCRCLILNDFALTFVSKLLTFVSKSLTPVSKVFNFASKRLALVGKLLTFVSAALTFVWHFQTFIATESEFAADVSASVRQG